MKNKTTIKILFLINIKIISNISLNNIFSQCSPIEFFNAKKRKRYIILKQGLKKDPIGEGSFGKVHNMIIEDKKISVRTKNFKELLEKKNFKAKETLKELIFLSDFVRKLNFVKKIRNREIFLKNKKILIFNKDKIEHDNLSPGGQRTIAFALVNQTIIFKNDYNKGSRSDFYNKYIKIIRLSTEDIKELENEFIDFYLKLILKKYGTLNFHRIINQLYNSLKPKLFLNFFGCIIDEKKEELHYFIDTVEDNLINELQNFREIYQEGERIKYYITILTEIRKFHIEYESVILNISPKNFMVTKKFDENKDTQLKLMQYNTISEINEEFKLKYLSIEFAHPSIINKKVRQASPYMDVYSFMLTIAYMEFGEESIKLSQTCYKEKYSHFCWDDLIKQIIRGFCKNVKKNNKDKRCEDEEEMVLSYRPKPNRNCKDILCYILSNIHYDENIMISKIDQENKWRDTKNNIICDFNYVRSLGEVWKYSPGGSDYFLNPDKIITPNQLLLNDVKVI